MSGISKTIERVKYLNQNRVGGEERRITEIAVGTFIEQYAIVAANSIMPIITAYEQSQKELGAVKGEKNDTDNTNTILLAELSTANKRIAELELDLAETEDALDVIHKGGMTSLDKTIAELREKFDLPKKEQTDERK